MNIIKASTEKEPLRERTSYPVCILYPARDSRNFFGTERTENQQLV